MKNLLIISIVFCLGTTKIWSQTDTLTVTEKESAVDIDKYERVYKLFIEDRDREIKHLWKLSLTGFALFYPEISFEQSLGKKWTCETGVGFGTPYPLLSYTGWKYIGEVNFIAGTHIDQGFKFLYNTERRERLGKRTNGFSANYFAVVFSGSYEAIWMDQYEGDTWKISGGIQYGLQRRLGNIGYIEGFAGIRMSYLETTSNYIYSYGMENEPFIEPYMGFKAGFAISSFKNLKKMVK